MSKIDLFDLNESKDLYRIIREVYEEYFYHPTERNFLFLALGFTHLREWISESNYEEIKQKKNSGQELTNGEQFFVDIHSLQSFRVIQTLCNRGKHHITSGGQAATSKAEGFSAGISRAGDSLGQLYFLIDGHDSREYFTELIKKYNEWFNCDD